MIPAQVPARDPEDRSFKPSQQLIQSLKEYEDVPGIGLRGSSAITSGSFVQGSVLHDPEELEKESKEDSREDNAVGYEEKTEIDRDRCVNCVCMILSENGSIL